MKETVKNDNAGSDTDKLLQPATEPTISVRPIPKPRRSLLKVRIDSQSNFSSSEASTETNATSTSDDSQNESESLSTVVLPKNVSKPSICTLLTKKSISRMRNEFKIIDQGDLSDETYIQKNADAAQIYAKKNNLHGGLPSVSGERDYIDLPHSETMGKRNEYDREPIIPHRNDRFPNNDSYPILGEYISYFAEMRIQDSWTFTSHEGRARILVNYFDEKEHHKILKWYPDIFFQCIKTLDHYREFKKDLIKRFQEATDGIITVHEIKRKLKKEIQFDAFDAGSDICEFADVIEDRYLFASRKNALSELDKALIWDLFYEKLPPVVQEGIFSNGDKKMKSARLALDYKKVAELIKPQLRVNYLSVSRSDAAEKIENDQLQRQIAGQHLSAYKAHRHKKKKIFSRFEKYDDATEKFEKDGTPIKTKKVQKRMDAIFPPGGNKKDPVTGKRKYFVPKWYKLNPDNYIPNPIRYERLLDCPEDSWLLKYITSDSVDTLKQKIKTFHAKEKKFGFQRQVVDMEDADVPCRDLNDFSKQNTINKMFSMNAISKRTDDPNGDANYFQLKDVMLDGVDCPYPCLWDTGGIKCCMSKSYLDRFYPWKKIRQTDYCISAAGSNDLKTVGYINLNVTVGSYHKTSKSTHRRTVTLAHVKFLIVDILDIGVILGENFIKPLGEIWGYWQPPTRNKLWAEYKDCYIVDCLPGDTHSTDIHDGVVLKFTSQDWSNYCVYSKAVISSLLVSLRNGFHAEATKIIVDKPIGDIVIKKSTSLQPGTHNVKIEFVWFRKRKAKSISKKQMMMLEIDEKFLSKGLDIYDCISSTTQQPSVRFENFNKHQLKLQNGEIVGNIYPIDRICCLTDTETNEIRSGLPDKNILVEGVGNKIWSNEKAFRENLTLLWLTEHSASYIKNRLRFSFQEKPAKPLFSSDQEKNQF